MKLRTAIDYGTLLSQARPMVIHTEEQNEKYTSLLEELAFKANPSKAEEQLIELLTVLIENFESERYPIESASPIEILSELMDMHNLKQKVRCLSLPQILTSSCT